MKNSYWFYKNVDCYHFPCHKVENKDEFNCKFCYCPLYFVEECGGDHRDNMGIKDCSQCLIPHRPHGYDYINRKLMDINEETRIKNKNKNKK